MATINLASDENAASSSLSAVSWGAIFAGAVVAAAMSLILFILGIGFGLGAISPWSSEGIGGGALGISAILWITFTSLVAAGVGGYLTGRLRTRWLATHTDEVYFRDTAHGFLAWGVATLLTAVIFTSATAGIASMGVKATAAIAGGAAQSAVTATGAGLVAGAASSAGANATDQSSGPLSYYLDSLFRSSVLTPVPVNAVNAQAAVVGNTADSQKGAAALPARQAALTAGGEGAEAGTAQAQSRRSEALPLAEVSRIFARAIQKDQLSQADLTYVGRLVARHTGLSAEEAEQRTSEIFASTQAELRQLETSVRQKADEARSTSSKVALWFFVALLAGAFTGSYSATIGGRQRDL